MTQAICPTCRAPLSKMPARKTRCKACGQFIYVKSTPDDRAKRLMTESQAESAEAAWQARYEGSRRDSVANMLGLPAGLSERVLRARLFAIAGDERADVHDRKMAALSMRTQFSTTAEERLAWEAVARRLDLESHVQNGVIDEVIIKTDDAECAVCRRLKDRRLTVRQAITDMPLPDPDCPRLNENRGGCRCWYRPIVAG